ncbi:MAG TPA: hypothetical protein VFK46_07875 [Candidatus Macondimonas sp.]|nr:hypothetical protein [Candidatus Macondimonas sp.]
MPVKARCYLALLSLLLLCPAGTASAQTAVPEHPDQVWQVGANRWDTAAEQRFAAWVEQTITEDFFLRYRIPVDCADVPYAIRWIYARMAHLPAAATLGDGRLLGHWSTDWGQLPTHREWHRDERFRAALSRMLAATSTRTLPDDTYPIRITPDSLRPGALFLIAASHAGMIGRIVHDGSTIHPIQIWEATLPRKIRKISEREFFATIPDPNTGSGLTRFRWPVFRHGRWQYLPVAEHPDYAMEQYLPGFCREGEQFDEAVARRIGSTPSAPQDRAEKLIQTLRRSLEDRVPIVLEGYDRCKDGGCPEGSFLWEVYSTPGRDSRITLLIQHLERLVESGQLDQEALRSRMAEIVIPIAEGMTVSLAAVVANHHWLSHAPGDSIEARWGLAVCPMIRARMENRLRALEFVEKRYRNTDPEYLPYGYSLHLDDLQWLMAEGKRAECHDLPVLPSTVRMPSEK